MKKGFTLIELLAVIVVLAVISLIAIPTMAKIIDKTRKGSIESSALGYVDAVEKQKAINDLNAEQSDDLEDGVYTVPLSKYKVKVNGESPKKGWIEIDKNGVQRYSLLIGEYTITNDGSKVTVTKGEHIVARPKVYPEYVYTQATKTFRIGDPVDGGLDLGEKYTITDIKTSFAFNTLEECNVLAQGFNVSCEVMHYYTPELSYLTKPNSSWDAYLRLKLDNNGNITSASACHKGYCLEPTLAIQSKEEVMSQLKAVYPGYADRSYEGVYSLLSSQNTWVEVRPNTAVSVTSEIDQRACMVHAYGIAGCVPVSDWNQVWGVEQ